MKPLLIVLACFLLLSNALAADSTDPLPPGRVVREIKGATFLTKMRFADPNYQVFLMACLKGQELNLLLSRNLGADEIPLLLNGLIGQLSKEFPGEDLTIVAFRPVTPLREYATITMSSATGEVKYRQE